MHEDITEVCPGSITCPPKDKLHDHKYRKSLLLDTEQFGTSRLAYDHRTYTFILFKPSENFQSL
jgi:hypothetical protein